MPQNLYNDLANWLEQPGMPAAGGFIWMYGGIDAGLPGVINIGPPQTTNIGGNVIGGTDITGGAGGAGATTLGFVNPATGSFTGLGWMLVLGLIIVVAITFNNK